VGDNHATGLVDLEAGAPDAALDGAIVDGTAESDAGYIDAGPVAPPRPIAPLSTATVARATPKLTWALPAGSDGAKVEVCSDRACTKVEQSFVTSGSSANTPSALTPGVHFWRLYAKVGTGIGATASPTWELVVGHRSAPRDGSWGAMLDFDGDGFADFAYGTDNAHAVTFIRGGAVGIDDTTARAVVASPSGPVPRFEFVANAGDVDGDGYIDVAIGQVCFDATPCASGTSNIFVYRGGPNGGAIPPVTDGGAQSVSPSFVLPSPAGESAQFGRAVKGVGDVNGDGYADLFVGAPTAGSGVAYVYFGSAQGLSDTNRIELSGSGEGFGIDGAGAGDVDGDGFADVLIGSSTALFAFLGGPTGPSSATRVPFTLPDSAAGAKLFVGISKGAGDLDGDGLPDVVLGVNSVSVDAGSQGQVYVYRGTEKNIPDLQISDVTLSGPTLNGLFGYATAIAGDLDGDGFEDLVVGAPSSAYGAGGVGAAYVFPGSAGGVSDGVRIALPDPSGGGGFGIVTAGGGSIQGTGRATAMVGSYLGDYVRIYALGAGRVPTSTRLTARPVGSWNYPSGLE
jgi:hypothetical protein